MGHTKWSEVRRDKTVSIRLTPAELADLTVNAKAEGVSIGALMRKRLFGGGPLSEADRIRILRDYLDMVDPPRTTDETLAAIEEEYPGTMGLAPIETEESFSADAVITEIPIEPSEADVREESGLSLGGTSAQTEVPPSDEAGGEKGDFSSPAPHVVAQSGRDQLLAKINRGRKPRPR